MPWLGLIDRISQCDAFVLLDNVAYSKNYFYNRNRIRTRTGWNWLTVPVLFGGKFGQLIKDIRIDNSTNWRQKHLKGIYLAYKKAPFFDRYYPEICGLLDSEWDLLSEISSKSMELSAGLFGIKKKFIRASELDAEGSKEELLQDICKRLKAKAYISGPDGANYLTPASWEAQGIKVIFQDFRHPEYPQCAGGFIPQMAAIDMLFNCGPVSLEILKDENGKKAELLLK